MWVLLLLFQRLPLLTLLLRRLPHKMILLLRRLLFVRVAMSSLSLMSARGVDPGFVTHA